MSESGEEYEIEKIIESRFTEVGRKEYSVKWVGYDEPTWEEAGQFDKDHKHLVEAYRAEKAVFRKKRKKEADSPNNNKRRKMSDTETDSSGPPDLEPYIEKTKRLSPKKESDIPISISSEDEADDILNDLNKSINSRPKVEKSSPVPERTSSDDEATQAIRKHAERLKKERDRREKRLDAKKSFEEKLKEELKEKASLGNKKATTKERPERRGRPKKTNVNYKEKPVVSSSSESENSDSDSDSAKISNPDSDDSISEDDEEYVVEDILSSRTKPLNGKRRGKILEYLIKWEGFPIEEATWEPADNLNFKKDEILRNILERYNKRSKPTGVKVEIRKKTPTRPPEKQKAGPKLKAEIPAKKPAVKKPTRKPETSAQAEKRAREEFMKQAYQNAQQFKTFAKFMKPKWAQPTQNQPTQKSRPAPTPQPPKAQPQQRYHSPQDINPPYEANLNFGEKDTWNQLTEKAQKLLQFPNKENIDQILRLLSRAEKLLKGKECRFLSMCIEKAKDWKKENCPEDQPSQIQNGDGSTPSYSFNLEDPIEALIHKIVTGEKIPSQKRAGEPISSQKMLLAMRHLDLDTLLYNEAVAGKSIDLIRSKAKKSFYQLSRKIHPDKCRVPRSEEAYQTIAYAKRVVDEKLDQLCPANAT